MDGHIPEDLIAKVRGSQDIVEVISRHISIKKSGQNYTGLCPFHSEKTPSFVVSPAKQLFHCFGCGTGGNVLTFLMKYENIPFPEAVKRLARDAGIAISDRVIKSGKNEEELFEANRLAASYYHETLLGAKEAESARKYLSGRGLTEGVIQGFNIGYAINSWSNIYGYLREKGFKDEILVKSGIVIPKNTGTGYYDRFRGRVMFPIYDTQKRVVGFGGRVLDDSTPKYLNSSETPIFSKGHLFYGLDIAKDSIRESGCAIIVEGYMDVIAAHQAGIPNVIGALGTAFTTNHLRIVDRFCKEVILTFDSDNAGINAALRTLDIFIGSEVRAKVLLLPEGEDPDSFIRKKGKVAFLEVVQKSKSLIDFALNRIIKKVPDLINSDSIDKKIKVVEECLPIIRKIPNRIEQDYYLQRVSKDLGIDKDVLYAELKRRNRDKKGSPSERTKGDVVKRQGAEEVLLTLIIKDRSLRKMVSDKLCIEDFVDPQSRIIAGGILNSDKDIHDIINSDAYDQGIRDIVTRLAFDDIYFDSPERTLSDCVRVLQRNRLDRELRGMEKEIASAELNGMFDKVKTLLQTKQGLLQRKRLLFEKN